MFLFVNREGNALITRTSLFVNSSFSLPELDAQLNALVSRIQVTPKPLVQLQGSLGGKNYINVFGENPLQIQLSGLVLGRNCNTLSNIKSSLGLATSFFQEHGVVNRVAPLTFTMTGHPSKQAFMVALTVTHATQFNDMSQFSMTLLSKSLRNEPPREPLIGIQRVPNALASGQQLSDDGLVGFSRENPRRFTLTESDVTELLSSGDPESPGIASVVHSGFNLIEDGFDV